VRARKRWKRRKEDGRREDERKMVSMGEREEREKEREGEGEGGRKGEGK